MLTKSPTERLVDGHWHEIERTALKLTEVNFAGIPAKWPVNSPAPSGQLAFAETKAPRCAGL